MGTVARAKSGPIASEEKVIWPGYLPTNKACVAHAPLLYEGCASNSFGLLNLAATGANPVLGKREEGTHFSAKASVPRPHYVCENFNNCNK
jgi:hypothetical protein